MRNQQSDMDLDSTATESVATESTMETFPPSVSATLQPALTPRYNCVGLSADLEETQVCATLQATELDDNDDSRRAPVDIVIALDVSGSMNGTKLDLCKETLKLLLRQLNEKDRFGLVTFASDVQVDIETAKMTKKAKDEALSKIMQLTTRGCTNLSGGISLAAREIREVTNPNEVRTIFLLTDGHANEGVTSDQGISQLVNGCLCGVQPPITLHCFGYGANHNEDLLLSISNATQGGTYYFVENDSSVRTAFGDALGGVLSVVAQNVVLKIFVPDEAKLSGVSITKVHHDKAVAQADGSFVVSLGDFYSEESRDVLVTVKLAADAIQVPHLKMSVSYADTINKTLVMSQEEECFIARPSNSDVSEANEHVEVQWLRVHAVEQMEAAKKESGEGQLPQARGRIASTLSSLMKGGRSHHPLVQQMAADLETVHTGLSSTSTYRAYGAKNLNATYQSHGMQRCAEADSSKTNAYRSSKKKKMTSAFKKDNN